MKKDKSIAKRLLEALTELHKQDFGEDRIEYERHQKEDDCWICQLISEGKQEVKK